MLLSFADVLPRLSLLRSQLNSGEKPEGKAGRHHMPGDLLHPIPREFADARAVRCEALVSYSPVFSPPSGKEKEYERKDRCQVI